MKTLITRKPYVAPCLFPEALQAAQQMLTTSNLPVGGSSDHFDSPHKDWSNEDFDWEESQQ